MFIAKNNDLIILAKDTQEELEQALEFMVYTDIEETDIEYELYGGKYLTPKEIETKEQERIQSLSMTRSDFFDGMIMAFGTDSEDLLSAIQNVLNNLSIDEVQKKIAINNYKNALNFYRKHDLFKLLSNIPIEIGEFFITITGAQWDRFFDETNKKNPEAYKELLN